MEIIYVLVGMFPFLLVFLWLRFYSSNQQRDQLKVWTRRSIFLFVGSTLLCIGLFAYTLTPPEPAPLLNEQQVQPQKPVPNETYQSNSNDNR